MMYIIIFLLVLLTLVTLLHLNFLLRTYIRFSVHWLLPESDNIIYPKFNSSTDRLRTVFSFLFFFIPLLVFNEYKKLPFENKIFHITILTILLGSTCLLLYINKQKIWSKSFRTISKKKNKIDLLINFIEGRFTTINNSVHHNRVAITGNKRALKNLKFLVNKNRDSYSGVCVKFEKIKKSTNQNSEKVSHLNEVLSETESKVDHVKSIVDSLKTTNKEESKSFEKYFKSEELFQAIITALKENNFFDKPSRINSTNLSILVAKLIDLKLINTNIKQKNLCKALENYFKIKKVDPSILSKRLNSFKDNSASLAHQDTYDSFSYLDYLI